MPHHVAPDGTGIKVHRAVEGSSSNAFGRRWRAAARPSALVAVALFYVVAIAPIWFSLGDHTLYGRSEGRYATVSWEMLQSGNWLVPHLNEQPHLTKPPLIYWLEAAALCVIGHSELAVRLPAAAAGSLTVLFLMCLAWRIGGSRRAVLAAAVLSMMPLHVALSRLTVTDALLSLFWFGTLAAACQAVHEPDRRCWPLLFWLSVALGLMTKGPIAWIPVAVVFAWLGLAGQWGSLLRLRPVSGFLLSLVPLAVWVIAIAMTYPDVVELWRREMIDRVAGGGDHNEPFWYFIPVLACGLFPATVMLSLPGWNEPWRMATERLRSAKPQALWALALVIPFVLFSISSGKLASYLLPLGPPGALLAANTLDIWLRGEADRPRPKHRPPDVRISLFISVTTSTIAAMIALLLIEGHGALWAIAPLVLLPLSCGYLMAIWHRRRNQRAAGLAAVWFVAVCIWLWALVGENWLLRPGSERRMLEDLPGMIETTQARLVTFGYTSDSLSFYHKQEVPRIKNAKDLAKNLKRFRHQLTVVADAQDWKVFAPKHAAITDQFTKVTELQSRAMLGKTRWVLRAQDVGPNETENRKVVPAPDSSTDLLRWP